MIRYRNSQGRMLEERGYRLDGTPVKRLNIERHIRVIRGNTSGDLDLSYVDRDVPVTLVRFPGGRTELVDRASSLCMPDFTVTGDKATDEQIVQALVGDQSVYA